jgi:hypothetical protein
MRLSVCRGEQRWVVEGPSERQQTTEGVRANGGSVSALPAQEAQRVGDWGESPWSRRSFGGEAVAAKSRIISG